MKPFNFKKFDKEDEARAEVYEINGARKLRVTFFGEEKDTKKIMELGVWLIKASLWIRGAERKVLIKTVPSVDLKRICHSKQVKVKRPSRKISRRR